VKAGYISRIPEGKHLKTLVGFALLLVLGGATRPAFADGPRQETIRKILPTVVQVVIEQDGTRVRTGAGVIIGRRPSESSTDCYVLTASHVVTGLPDGQIYVLLERHRGTGRRTRATLLAHRESGSLDAALLKIQPEAGCVAAELGNAPALGDDILAFGFPWGRAMTLTSGIVSQVPLEESEARLMIDASVSYGVSGGGVYDAKGRLMGIVEGYRTAQVSYRDSDKDAKPRSFQIPVPGETYVVSLSEIRRFLQETGLIDVVLPR
jgi:S1-C subfamily serine protease